MIGRAAQAFACLAAFPTDLSNAVARMFAVYDWDPILQVLSDPSRIPADPLVRVTEMSRVLRTRWHPPITLARLTRLTRLTHFQIICEVIGDWPNVLCASLIVSSPEPSVLMPPTDLAIQARCLPVAAPQVTQGDPAVLTAHVEVADDKYRIDAVRLCLSRGVVEEGFHLHLHQNQVRPPCHLAVQMHITLLTVADR